MKIVILDAETLSINGDIDFSIFDQYGEVTVYPFTRDEQVGERIRDAEVVLCNKSIMDEQTLSQASKLKYIGLFATGYNNIDIAYTNAHGITVCNAGSYSTEAVAQHVFALILHVYNKVADYNTFVQQEGWIHTHKFSPFIEMKELYGKTIGIIGYGSIGKKVARIAEAFGMHVLAYSRNIAKNPQMQTGEDKSIQYADIPAILAASDIVTVHCPLNKDSEKMCSKDFFTKMKRDALFINTARGGIVNENDLVWALTHDEIAGAAIDVISKEPMEPNCPLLHVKNLVITPHAAWAPLETRMRLIQIVSENLKKWLAGTPTYVIK